MKVGALKAAIRAGGTPFFTATLKGFQWTFTLQKGPLLDQIDLAFPEGKAQETGMRLTDEGQLEWEDHNGDLGSRD